jgi:hypothetical protein
LLIPQLLSNVNLPQYTLVRQILLEKGAKGAVSLDLNHSILKLPKFDHISQLHRISLKFLSSSLITASEMVQNKIRSLNCSHRLSTLFGLPSQPKHLALPIFIEVQLANITEVLRNPTVRGVEILNIE